MPASRAEWLSNKDMQHGVVQKMIFYGGDFFPGGFLPRRGRLKRFPFSPVSPYTQAKAPWSTLDAKARNTLIFCFTVPGPYRCGSVVSVFEYTEERNTNIY